MALQPLALMAQAPGAPIAARALAGGQGLGLDQTRGALWASALLRHVGSGSHDQATLTHSMQVPSGLTL